VEAEQTQSIKIRWTDWRP